MKAQTRGAASFLLFKYFTWWVSWLSQHVKRQKKSPKTIKFGGVWVSFFWLMSLKRLLTVGICSVVNLHSQIEHDLCVCVCVDVMTGVISLWLWYNINKVQFLYLIASLVLFFFLYHLPEDLIQFMLWFVNKLQLLSTCVHILPTSPCSEIGLRGAAAAAGGLGRGGGGGVLFLDLQVAFLFWSSVSLSTCRAWTSSRFTGGSQQQHWPFFFHIICTSCLCQDDGSQELWQQVYTLWGSRTMQMNTLLCLTLFSLSSLDDLEEGGCCPEASSATDALLHSSLLCLLSAWITALIPHCISIPFSLPHIYRHRHKDHFPLSHKLVSKPQKKRLDNTSHLLFPETFMHT